MTETITMRIWTAMGKENICHIADFRTHNGEIQITSGELDQIHHIIETGDPCCISFLTCYSDNEVGRYLEHTYRGCSLIDGQIRFQALCVPS